MCEKKDQVLNISPSIPLKPYFKGFCWGISKIFHGVYLTYTQSHRVLIHLKGLTVNMCIKP